MIYPHKRQRVRTLKYYIFTIASILVALSGSHAAPPPAGRIIFSSDGNQHDKDDIAASAFTLAIISKSGIGSNLKICVHSDHIWDNNSDHEAHMEETITGTISRFPDLDHVAVYNGFRETDAAIDAIKTEIDQSSSSDPLWIICAGPMEIIGRAVKAANSDKRKHVTIITHSTWNNEHAKTDHNGYSLSDIVGLGAKQKKIKDQNKTFRVNYSKAHWLRDSNDPALNWLWDRAITADKTRLDVSNCGMAWYFTQGYNSAAQNGSFEELKKFLASGSIKPPNILASALPTAPDFAFVEKNGIVMIEAESGNLPSQWKKRTNISGAQGSGHIEFTGTSTFDSYRAPKIKYPVKISKTGEYTLALRCRNGIGASGPKSKNVDSGANQMNDCWIEIEEAKSYKIGDYKLNSQIPKVWVQSKNDWSWDSFGEYDEDFNSTIKATFSKAGTYNITLGGRSKGFVVDRIAIWHKSVNKSDATANSLSESDTTPYSAPPVDEAGPSTADYQDENGVVVIEAENTPSDYGEWVQKTNINGYTGTGFLEFTGNTTTNGNPNSPLEYTFKINKAGLYYLHLYGARENVDGRTDLANDCYLRVTGDFDAGPWAGNNPGNDAKESLLRKNTKFYGGNHKEFVWITGNRFDPGGHNNKRVATYTFKAGKKYKLVISGRSQLFKLDRIVFRHTKVDEQTAQDKSLAETLNDNSNPTDSYHFPAINFSNINAGVVPFYIDDNRNALAIDASNASYRNKYARATTTFEGNAGTYDLTLTTLQETDGECTYQLFVNGTKIGTVTNKSTSSDYIPQVHVFKNVSIPANATLSVEAQSVSNGKIPEKDGFAFARGRWTDLSLVTSTSDNSDGDGTVTITGELKRWHKVTLKLEGLYSDEKANPNPFSDYRMLVTFTHPNSGLSYTVPGYFAANGDAANTSATSGNIWQAHLSPDEVGTWNYSISFRQGSDVAILPNAKAGSKVGAYDGLSGSFAIQESDKVGVDFRGKGRLTYVNKHHLQFAGSGKYFLKAGPDAPENLLAYDDIDDTPNDPSLKENLRKSWQPHMNDYDANEASAYTWGPNNNKKGKALLGALKYLADEGLNSFSFLTFNVDGDDDNVFPHLLRSDVAGYESIPDNDENDETLQVSTKGRWADVSNGVHHDRFDISKMAQWEQVFCYATQKGLYMDIKTQETENDRKMDSGDLGRERKLYYRELIARFGHHLALNWNLGEESDIYSETNDPTQERVKAYTQFFYDHDPYRHNIVIHSYPGDKVTRYEKVYQPLLGNNSKLTGASLQTNQENFSNVFKMVNHWVNESAATGTPWVVACDEPGDARLALRPDSDPGNSHVDGRKNALWGTVMAGGAGVNFYFGYERDHSDLTCQDFRSRDAFWDYCRYMLEFFNKNEIPFQDMSNDNSLSTNKNSWCLAKPGDTYVIYLKNGGTTQLDLSNVNGNFSVKWYNPRNGGNLIDSNITEVTAGSEVSLGNAPSSTSKDWVILVQADKTPPVSTLNKNTIKENLARGTEVGLFSIDEFQKPLTIEFVKGSGSANNNSFSLGGQDGNALLTKRVFDHEIKSNYTIRIRISDAASHVFTSSFSIKVTDDRDEDFDGDGLSEKLEETVYGSSDLIVDSDGDGDSDMLEAFQGTDPANSTQKHGLVGVDPPGLEDMAVRYRRGTNQTNITINSKWSIDLINWYESGKTVGDQRVVINKSVVETGADYEIVESTLTVTRGDPLTIFYKNFFSIQN